MKLVRFAVKGQIHTGILEGNMVIGAAAGRDWLTIPLRRPGGA